ncbi:hypothetical protein DFJ77DRAFT_447197 [Powellomyces hirtus]|nr:hypothetical protein DFJ77DRAFT_447197 [Powellomyces hirtus]
MFRTPEMIDVLAALMTVVVAKNGWDFTKAMNAILANITHVPEVAPTGHTYVQAGGGVIVALGTAVQPGSMPDVLPAVLPAVSYAVAANSAFCQVANKNDGSKETKILDWMQIHIVNVGSGDGTIQEVVSYSCEVNKSGPKMTKKEIREKCTLTNMQRLAIDGGDAVLGRPGPFSAYVQRLPVTVAGGQFQQYKLDSAIITHLDTDHLAGFIPILEKDFTNPAVRNFRRGASIMLNNWFGIFALSRSRQIIVANKGPQANKTPRSRALHHPKHVQVNVRKPRGLSAVVECNDLVNFVPDPPLFKTSERHVQRRHDRQKRLLLPISSQTQKHQERLSHAGWIVEEPAMNDFSV